MSRTQQEKVVAGRSARRRGHSTGAAPAPHPHRPDVTSGNNGSCSTSYLCTATTGYDGPTGWGTPEGVTAFTG
ncbi:hypothetical protein [Streptomyces sp. NPDC018036]|uniref:hypothetical protein n=1 Tax=Streptomyces sp. NPDC018036 TaxID=3365035 RepID=UPI0037AC8953